MECKHQSQPSADNKPPPSGPIALPAIPIGKFCLFLVNEVNGPASARQDVPLSRHEALVLARYWLERYVDCQEWIRIQYSSSDFRVLVYAESRVKELRDAGLVTQQQIDQIFDEIDAENAKECKSQRATRKRRK
jgi:hypothetical protein